jgi:CRP/FNR family nitrogen fixation transcriptional regulator
VPGTIDLRQQPFGTKPFTRQSIPNVDTEAFDQLIDRIGVRISYAPKERIFHENDPAERVYKVVSGLVLTCKFLSDGRRQIGKFYLPGDYFGFATDAHTLSAEAATNAEVRIVKKSVLAAVANRDAIERQLLWLTTRELAHFQERALLLCKNAQERVGEFILEMEKRSKVRNSIQLRMKRQDIADYLGLTIETVSRVLTWLESRAAIELPLHRIVLCNHSVLRAAMEDRSNGNGALSNPHPSKSTARKRSDRRHSARTRVRKRVLPEAVLGRG